MVKDSRVLGQYHLSEHDGSKKSNLQDDRMSALSSDSAPNSEPSNGDDYSLSIMDQKMKNINRFLVLGKPDNGEAEPAQTVVRPPAVAI